MIEQEDLQGAEADPLPGPVEWALFAFACLLVTLVTWSWVLRLPLTGMDVWPIFAQAQTVLGNPLALFTDRYLVESWDGATFWRPATMAIAAPQFALFGDAPLPYHASRLLVLLATALVVARSAALVAPGARVAAVLGAAIYLLHPIQVESVPAVARSADGWSALAMSGALLALAEARARTHPGRWIALGVLLALITPGFKEPALLVLPLAMLVLAPWKRQERGASAALAGSLALGLGLVFHVGYRFALLGTLGSYKTQNVRIAPVDAARELVGALLDHPGLGWPIVAVLVCGGLGIALALPERFLGRALPSAPRLALAHAGWLFVTSLAFLTSMRFKTRYAEAVLVPFAILVAVVLSALWDAARRDRRIRTLAGALLASLIVPVILLPGTPLVWSYPQWQVSGQTQERVLDALGEVLDEVNQEGGTAKRQEGPFLVQAAEVEGDDAPAVSVAPFPIRTGQPVGRRQRGLSTAVIMGAHSIRAYALTTRGLRLTTIHQGADRPVPIPRPEP